MDHKLINKAVANCQQGTASTPPTESTSTAGGSSMNNPLVTAKHIAALWTRFTSLYGHKWTSSYGDSDADGVWLRVLSKLTPAQLAQGLEQVVEKGSEWPPSAPEFRALCAGAALAGFNLPSPEAAFDEARRKSHSPSRETFSHPAVRIAGASTGWFDLAQDEGKDPLVRLRFEREYQIVCRRVINGEQIDADIPVGLEDTRNKPRKLTEKDREAGRERIKELKSLVGTL